MLCCRWARGSFCQSTLWIASCRGGSSVTKASIKDSVPRAWATSHDDELLTGATVHAATVDRVSSSVLHHDLDARLQRLDSTPTGQLKTTPGQKIRTL